MVVNIFRPSFAILYTRNEQCQGREQCAGVDCRVDGQAAMAAYGIAWRTHTAGRLAPPLSRSPRFLFIFLLPFFSSQDYGRHKLTCKHNRKKKQDARKIGQSRKKTVLPFFFCSETRPCCNGWVTLSKFFSKIYSLKNRFRALT